jgi:glycosyltransferase involved in cell wall biosynthesis
MPTVSVIVPNYNHASYLRERIESVLEQTYQDFEVILLDDCSSDHSREILASYGTNPKVRIEFNAKNSGTVFKQWNKGVQMARGRYIWIAESDDYADPRFLARMVPILEEHTKVTFAYCRSWTIGEDDQRFGFADSYMNGLDANHWTADFVVDGLEECRRFFVLSAPVPNSSAVLFRKDVYVKVGRADQGFCICGDYKVWAAMALEGEIAYLAEPLNYYRSHRENVRTRTQAGALNLAEYFYVMLSVVNRVAPPETITQKTAMKQILSRLPIELSPRERIQVAQQALSYVADWNLRHNPHVAGKAMRAYFGDWEFALAGKEFDISPPSRWRFFLHRCRFYRHYFPGMGWKLRLVNLMRMLGAPVVGYRHRHWPEQAYARVMRKLGYTLSKNTRS